MTHVFLQDPENAKAYQALSDHPRGSTRAWAKQAGWTHSKMVRFLDALERAGIAEVVTVGRGSLFRTVPKRSETFRAPDLGSKSESDKVPRYGEAPRQQKPPTAIEEPDAVRLIQTANAVLLEREWPTLPESNFGCLAGARKILKIVPVDRAVPLLEEAVRQFNPSATGGGTLKSLGHPFITRYVINEYRRIQRDQDHGQLPIIFVETVQHRTVYGARKIEPDIRPTAQGDTIDAGVEEFHRVAASKTKPQRMA